MFQAETEHFSKYKRQNKLCEKISNCQKELMEGAKHEMLQEKDEIRDKVLAKIKLFLKN